MALQPQNFRPEDVYVTPVSRTWTTTGNTDTVTDEAVQAGSIIQIMNTSAYAGRWYVSTVTPTTFSTNAITGVITETAGSFVITSSNSETQTTTTYKYLIV